MDPERFAAVSILVTECGITPPETETTAALWQMIFVNNVCFAKDFQDNIFNDTKPWEVIENEIRSANMNRLKEIYYTHTKLQSHPQFLAGLTRRKKKLLRYRA